MLEIWIKYINAGCCCCCCYCRRSFLFIIVSILIFFFSFADGFLRCMLKNWKKKYIYFCVASDNVDDAFGIFFSRPLHSYILLSSMRNFFNENNKQRQLYSFENITKTDWNFQINVTTSESLSSIRRRQWDTRWLSEWEHWFDFLAIISQAAAAAATDSCYDSSLIINPKKETIKLAHNEYYWTTHCLSHSIALFLANDAQLPCIKYTTLRECVVLCNMNTILAI